MKKNLRYLWYVLRHKWFVFQAGLALGAPLWQLIIHDWSKFLPGEWTPYVRKFYGGKYPKANHGDMKFYFGDQGTQPWVDEQFNYAWNRHQKRNPHHWQYWLLHLDSGSVEALPMPDRYIREMVADWVGAGRAITGRIEVAEWYIDNCDRMVLHPATRHEVERLLDEHFHLSLHAFSMGMGGDA